MFVSLSPSCRLLTPSFPVSLIWFSMRATNRDSDSFQFYSQPAQLVGKSSSCQEERKHPVTWYFSSPGTGLVSAGLEHIGFSLKGDVKNFGLSSYLFLCGINESTAVRLTLSMCFLCQDTGNSRLRRALECCTDQDYCNRDLHPTLPPQKPPRKSHWLTLSTPTETPLSRWHSLSLPTSPGACSTEQDSWVSWITAQVKPGTSIFTSVHVPGSDRVWVSSV